MLCLPDAVLEHIIALAGDEQSLTAMQCACKATRRVVNSFIAHREHGTIKLFQQINRNFSDFLSVKGAKVSITKEIDITRYYLPRQLLFSVRLQRNQAITLKYERQHSSTYSLLEIYLHPTMLQLNVHFEWWKNRSIPWTTDDAPLQFITAIEDWISSALIRFRILEPGRYVNFQVRYRSGRLSTSYHSCFIEHTSFQELIREIRKEAFRCGLGVGAVSLTNMYGDLVHADTYHSLDESDSVTATIMADY